MTPRPVRRTRPYVRAQVLAQVLPTEELLALARRVMAHTPDVDREDLAQQLAIGIVRLESDLAGERRLLTEKKLAHRSTARDLEATRLALSQCRQERDAARALLLDRSFNHATIGVTGLPFAAASAELDRQVAAEPPLPMLFGEDDDRDGDTNVCPPSDLEAVPMRGMAVR